MKTNLCFLFFIAAFLLTACVSMPTQTEHMRLRQQVFETEQAFAHSMAIHDHVAFTSFLSDETIFFSDETVLRGKQQVANAWKRFFTGKTAPFSWQPEQVEVLDSGTLALSSGPVHNSEGELIATYTSIWRRDKNNKWRIIFDKGNPVYKKP